MTGLRSISEVARAFDVAVSALRYYDELGLVPCTERRGTVRFYDDAALIQLAWVQLWHDDGLLSLAETRAVVDSGGLEARRTRVREQRDAIRLRLRALARAEAVLDHMLSCESDDPLACEMTGGYLRERVRAALEGREAEPGFWPASVTSP
jgi:DNA-binding transcriptional MerR regulator